MESYAEQGAGADSIEQIGFGGARRTKKKHRGLTVFQGHRRCGVGSVSW